MTFHQTGLLALTFTLSPSYARATTMMHPHTVVPHRTSTKERGPSHGLSKLRDLLRGEELSGFKLVLQSFLVHLVLEIPHLPFLRHEGVWLCLWIAPQSLSFQSLAEKRSFQCGGLFVELLSKLLEFRLLLGGEGWSLLGRASVGRRHGRTRGIVETWHALSRDVGND